MNNDIKTEKSRYSHIFKIMKDNLKLISTRKFWNLAYYFFDTALAIGGVKCTCNIISKFSNKCKNGSQCQVRN